METEIEMDEIRPAPHPYPYPNYTPDYRTFLKNRPYHDPESMKSVSRETLGKASSHGSVVTNSSLPKKPEQARVASDSGNLELDQPLERIEPVMPIYRTRRGVYAPTQRTGIQRTFWIYTICGLVMIATLIFTCVFGVIFAVVETKGALKEGGTPEYNASADVSNASTPFVATTLVPFSFSTLVPSSYSTLVPTEITVYVQSEATTLVHSDAVTLVPSLVTITQREATASVENTNVGILDQVEKRDDGTSTTSLTMSITTTVTVAVYSTTFGHHALQSASDGNGVSQQTCGSGAQKACMLTTNVLSGIQSSFMRSTVSASLLDLNFTTTASTDMSDGATTTAMPSTNPPDSGGVDTATITDSLVCTITEISGTSTCSPAPTGWHISPSPPRASSILHPAFRFISSLGRLFRIEDSSAYEHLHASTTLVCEQCGKAFAKDSGGGKEATESSILSFVFPCQLNLKMRERVGQLAKGGGMPPPPMIPRGE